MDLVLSVKEKLNYFRIKELKDVLTQLHLSKQGKKQDLVDCILSVLSDEQVSKMWAKNNAVGKEQVAKLVDDTYRKMQISGATDLASKRLGASDSCSVNLFCSVLTCCCSNQVSTRQPHSNKTRMFSFGRNCCFKYPSTYFRRRNASNNTNTLLSRNSFCHPFGKNSHTTRFFHHAHKLDPFLFQISTSYTQFPIPFAPFNSRYSTKAPSRSYQRRARKRLLNSSKPTLNQAQFQLALSQIPPRFTPEELCNVIAGQNDPLVCLELFHWASQQPRFRHDVSTFHVTIKKLGAAKMYQEMDDIVNQLLAVPLIGSEALFNMVIYYFTQARKLTRAVNVFKHMKSRRNLKCCFRPSIRTYNILFAAFLGRGSNSYINHVYMETIRCLFRQMISDGIKPDIFSLNSMIKGYVLSLHVNNALRIFHQMGVVYDCPPNALTYDCLIHGLCAQGRTNNAKELYYEMKTKGFVPSSKSYNSLVNSLALGGEIEEAVNYLWEMTDKQRSADFITYKTVLDEICRRGTVQEGVRFLQELQEKDLVDGHAYRKLLYVLEDDYGNSISRTVGTQ